MHTAISVARESGMVLRNDKIMICKAFTQEEGDSASIEWEPTELPVREVSIIRHLFPSPSAPVHLNALDFSKTKL